MKLYIPYLIPVARISYSARKGSGLDFAYQIKLFDFMGHIHI